MLICGVELGLWERTTVFLRLIVVLSSAQALVKDLQRFWRVDVEFATKVVSSAYSSSRINSCLTFDCARRRERLNNLPDVRQCIDAPDGFGNARMSSAVKKIAEVMSKDPPLLDATFDRKTMRCRAIDLNSCMHAVAERQDDAEQCFRAVKSAEDRE